MNEQKTVIEIDTVALERRIMRYVTFAHAYGASRRTIAQGLVGIPTKRQRRLCQRTGHIPLGVICRRCGVELAPRNDQSYGGTITGRFHRGDDDYHFRNAAREAQRMIADRHHKPAFGNPKDR